MLWKWVFLIILYVLTVYLIAYKQEGTNGHKWVWLGSGDQPKRAQMKAKRRPNGYDWVVGISTNGQTNTNERAQTSTRNKGQPTQMRLHLSKHECRCIQTSTSAGMNAWWPVWAHIDDTRHTDKWGWWWAQTNEAGADKWGWAHTDKMECGPRGKRVQQHPQRTWEWTQTSTGCERGWAKDRQTMAGVGVAAVEAAAEAAAIALAAAMQQLQRWQWTPSPTPFFLFIFLLSIVYLPSLPLLSF